MPWNARVADRGAAGQSHLVPVVLEKAATGVAGLELVDGDDGQARPPLPPAPLASAIRVHTA
jgi:hypothetical protein